MAQSFGDNNMTLSEAQIIQIILPNVPAELARYQRHNQFITHVSITKWLVKKFQIEQMYLAVGDRHPVIEPYFNPQNGMLARVQVGAEMDNSDDDSENSQN